MYFIDVILPIPLKQTFTYQVNKDEALFLKPGMRVAVPFGKTKIFTAIVYRTHKNAAPAYETKEIYQILDEHPIITAVQLQHWEWVANYYMCTMGEMVRTALPSAFLLESQTVITLHPNHKDNKKTIEDDAFLVVEAFKQQTTLNINEIRSIVDKKAVLPLLQQMMQKQIVKVHEEISELYRPKLVKYVKLAPRYVSEKNLKPLLKKLSNAPKQREVLLTLFTLSAQQSKPINTKVLQKKSKAASATLKVLVEKGILEEFYQKKDRVQYTGGAKNNIKPLSPAQQVAYNEIETSFKKFNTTLLHGVTSSGKTEIYSKLISEILKTGKQVLYMVPEIVLTTQLITRLQHYFGEKIAVYHSKYSVNERVEVWNNVLQAKPRAQVVIGARSSLFLPFKKLGLIIVDEAHEPSYKQHSPAPRYNARDSAVMLAKFHGAKTVMGSATPSLETYHNAVQQKYGLVTLTERFGNILMPTIELVDIKEECRKKKMKGHFSERLLFEITKTLNAGKQVLLFQNRRGYSPIVACTTCGTAPQCPNCDVSLTYHKFKNQLRCHYCGYNMAMQQSCIACGSDTLDTKGLGTQQVETELKSLFPSYTTARMDQDTTRGKNSYAKLIDRLDNGEVDILVGTQMLAKGLDFRNIDLVGVMNADSLLNFPDFRAHERAYQLLQQVSGRAGRTQTRGKVLIQTY
ncbi:MAG: replication restart helicase PriA, partial [Marinirhabdus sp.]